MLARFAANNHTLADDELRPYGIGMFPKGGFRRLSAASGKRDAVRRDCAAFLATGALVNHSDTPSAVQLFHGSQMAFVTLRDLAPGDEVRSP